MKVRYGLAPGLYTVVAHTTASRNPNVDINTRSIFTLVEVSEDGETVVDLALD